MGHRKNFPSLSAAFTIVAVVLPKFHRITLSGLVFLAGVMPLALGQAPAGRDREFSGLGKIGRWEANHTAKRCTGCVS